VFVANNEQEKTSAPVQVDPTSAPTKEAVTEAPSPVGHAFTREGLETARTVAKASLDMLYKYYGEAADKVLLGDTGLGYGFTGPDKAPSNPVVRCFYFGFGICPYTRTLFHVGLLCLSLFGYCSDKLWHLDSACSILGFQDLHPNEVATDCGRRDGVDNCEVS
jgi:hypothetical protein